MAFVLVFNREAQLNGLIFPAGAIVPAGSLTARQLTGLRATNRIVEVRDEDLGDSVPRPHRIPQVEGATLLAARDRVKAIEASLGQARGELAELERLDAEDHAPVDEFVAERRGATVDLNDLVAVRAERLIDEADEAEADEAGDGDLEVRRGRGRPRKEPALA